MNLSQITNYLQRNYKYYCIVLLFFTFIRLSNGEDPIKDGETFTYIYIITHMNIFVSQ